MKGVTVTLYTPISTMLFLFNKSHLLDVTVSHTLRFFTSTLHKAGKSLVF